MHCKDVMTRDVQWVPPDETISAAAKLMAFHNLGFLPICEGDGFPIGVLTDRDIALRVVGEERNAAVTTVREVMSRPVQFVRLETPMSRMREIMTNEGVSRLLVLDEVGHLVGIVSLGDLLVHASGHQSLETLRGLYAREARNDPDANPRPATAPTPEYFQGNLEPPPPQPPEPTPENSARLELENVAHGGTNVLKEFPA